MHSGSFWLVEVLKAGEPTVVSAAAILRWRIVARYQGARTTREISYVGRRVMNFYKVVEPQRVVLRLDGQSFDLAWNVEASNETLVSVYGRTRKGTIAVPGGHRRGSRKVNLVLSTSQELDHDPP